MRRLAMPPRVGCWAARLGALVLAGPLLVVLGPLRVSATVLYSVALDDNLLRVIDPATGATLSATEMTIPGDFVDRGWGLAAHPTTGELWGLVELNSGQFGRKLVVIDPLTAAAIPVGDTGDRFEGLAFDAAGALYGVTGDDANVPKSLFTLSTVDATPTLLGSVGGGIGDAIAFEPADGLLYHLAGSSPPLFESVEPPTVTRTAIPLSGAAVGQAGALARQEAGVLLLAGTDPSFSPRLFTVTTGGLVTSIGPLDHTAKGLALTGGRVLYSVSSDDHRLRGIVAQDANGNYPTAFSVPITVPGLNVLYGTALAANPLTRVLWAVVGTDEPLPGRALVTVDPASGVGALVGPPGDDFVGLAFDAAGTLYGVTSSSAATPAALFRLSTADATPTFLTTLATGPSDDHTLAFDPRGELLYHAASSSHIFESIDPGTLAVNTIAPSGYPFWGSTAMTHLAANVLLLAGPGGDMVTMTTGGSAEFVGFLDHNASGLAFLPVPGCGNGVVESGEACDDGNTAGGDCCGPTCQLEASGSPCADDGNPCTQDECDGTGGCTHPANAAPCEDGDPCTTGDACSGGTCVGGPPPTCGLCETCEPGVGCAVPATLGCQPADPQQSALLIRDGADNLRDLVSWRWRAGGPVTKDDFGDPTSTTGLTLCVIDHAGAAPARRLAYAIPPGGTCPGGVPCWTESDTGFKLNDRATPPTASLGLVLKAGGGAGRAKIAVKRRKGTIGVPGLPFTPPAMVRLVRSDAPICWEARFTTAVRRNDVAQFKARSD